MSKSTVFPIVALVATMLLFSLWPDLDLHVSGWFWTPQDGFWLARSTILAAFRRGFWIAGGLGIVALLVLTILSLSLQKWLTIPARIWGRGLLAMVLGPGLVVNLLLKNNWGRARPRNITQFGGTADFTPPLTITDQCARNCSFVSGEGALAVTLVLVLWGIFFAGAAQPLRRIGGWSLTTLAVMACALRIMFGGHFLSDTLFAAAICALIVGLLQHTPGLTATPPQGPGQVWADLRIMAKRLGPGFRRKH